MTEIAARAKNIQLQVLKVQHRDDLAEAFAAARNAEAQALNIFASPFLSSLSGEIIGVSAAQRLPAIYQWKEHVESGGLVSLRAKSSPVVAAGRHHRGQAFERR